MNLRARICLYCGLVASFFGGAVIYLRWPAPAPELITSHARKPAVRLVPVTVENEMTTAKREIGQRAVALLIAEKYSELDSMAAEFRRNQTHFVNGYWNLSLFYAALCDLETKVPEVEWAKRIELLRRWFEEDPDLITPRLAMARGLIGYAWHARGNSWASKVPRDAWPVVYERIIEANRILEAARNLPENCPYWYTTWMSCALLGRVSRECYDEIFEQGVKSFPTYTPIYFAKAWYLQERWYGTRGEWERFAAGCAERSGQEQSDILYAQIVWYFHEQRVFGNPITEGGVDWPRVRRGFEAIRRRYPHSILALSEYCSLSGFAPSGARELMRGLFRQVNNRVDLQVWHRIDLFVRDQRWAYTAK